MNLRETILAEHSKAQKDLIIKWVGTDQTRYDELVNIFLQDEYRVTQRAAWPLSFIAIAQPQLIKKHLKHIVENLRKPNLHPAIKRNTVRLLQFIPIPKTLQGEVMQHCFSFIENIKEPVAIKAFSLTVLENLSKQYPEILPELKLLIEAQMDNQTAAFIVRAKKILNKPL